MNNNIKFPEDFFKFNGNYVSEKRINEWINEIINDNNDTISVSSGDTLVFKKNNKIIVAKNYWEFDLEGK